MPGGFEPVEVWIKKEYNDYKLNSEVRFCKWDKDGNFIEGKVVSNDGKVAIIEYDDGVRIEQELLYADRYNEIKEDKI